MIKCLETFPPLYSETYSFLSYFLKFDFVIFRSRGAPSFVVWVGFFVFQVNCVVVVTLYVVSDSSISCRQVREIQEPGTNTRVKALQRK